MPHKMFRADYRYMYSDNRRGVGTKGTWNRSQFTASNLELKNMGTTESSVVSYLKRKHQGADIELISLDWWDN